MYTLRITDDNNVITTVKESLMEKSNCVNSIQIIINKFYKEQIDMTDTTAYMKYVLPVTKKIKMTQLIADKASNGLNLRYKPGDTSNSNLIITIPNGKSVANYGYYTTVNGVKWYLVTYKDTPGFVSSRYLAK